MAILDVINLVIKNNPSLFKEVEKDFDDLIFLIITHQKDVTKKIVNISLKNPFLTRYNLKITIIERIETPVSLDFSYGYQIYSKENILDTNSILNYFRNYAVNFKLFYQYLEESFFEYLYNRKMLLEKFEILEIDTIKVLKKLKNNFEKITALIDENLEEVKDGFFTIEDLFVYSGKEFSIDCVSIQPDAIENLVFTFEEKGKGKKGLNYLIQIGDFVSDNDFLRVKDEINNPNRNHYLDEIDRGNERKYDFSIYNLIIEYGKTDQIESVIIEYNGGIDSETFTLDMEYGIGGKIYKLIGFDFPIFTLLDSFDLQYFTSKSKKIRNAFIDKADIRKSEIWDYINIGIKIPEFQITNISYITEPKIVLKFEGFFTISNGKWDGKFFKLYLLPYPLFKKTRFKILIKNLLQYDFKDLTSSEDIFNLEKYDLLEIPYDPQATEDYNEPFFYLYRNRQTDFLIIHSIEEITKLPYYQYPFQLDYLPVSHLNQSIIRIKRKDDTPFTRNNRYVLLKYFYEKIPQTSILKDSFYKMNGQTNKIVKDLHNFDLTVKEFGILFDIILSKKTIDLYGKILKDTFEEYAEKEDIKEDIIDELIAHLSSQKFEDGESKFENIESSVKIIKEGYKYELRINYNFFSLPEEVLLIRYIIGTKYFTIDLLTANNYHRNRYNDFVKKAFKKLTLDQIQEFIEKLMIDPYYYYKDVDDNSITTIVDNIIIKFRNQVTNEIKEELIKIGMKWKNFEWLWNYATEDPNKIVTQIAIIYNYKKDKIISVDVDSIEDNTSVQSFKFALDYFIDDWVVIELRTSEITSKEIDLTEFYKEIDEVYIKIGDSIGDIDAEFLLFVSVFTEEIKEIMGIAGEYLIRNIKISFDNEEVIIEAQEQENNKGFRFIFKINKEIIIEDVAKEFSTIIEPLCLGISQDITKLERIEKALIVFYLPNGTLEFVGYKVGMENPSFSLIDIIGKLEGISISDDNLKIKIVLNGKDYIFEVNENITYTIYISEKNKYQAHIENIPIFAIYRDEEALEEAKFEAEKVEFDLDKFSIESGKKGVGIWIEEEQDWSEILEQIRKEPEIRKIEEIIEEKEIEALEEEAEELIEEDIEEFIEEVKEELKKEEELQEIELLEEVVEEIERDEELEEYFEKETGKKAIWRGQETKAYKQWKGKTKEVEEELKKEEEIEAKKEFIDLDLNELPEFWDSLSEKHRIELGMTFGLSNKTDELIKDWDNFLYKDDLDFYFLHLIRVTKGLNFTLTDQNEVETIGIGGWWNNLSVKDRGSVLEIFADLLVFGENDIAEYKVRGWNEIEGDIGLDLIQSLVTIKNFVLNYKKPKKEEKIEEITEKNIGDMWNKLNIYGKKELLKEVGLGEEYAEYYAQFDWDDSEMETIKEDLLQEEMLDFITEWIREGIPEEEIPEEEKEKEIKDLKSAKRIYESFEILELKLRKESSILKLKEEDLKTFWVVYLCPELRGVLIEYLNIYMSEKRKKEEVYGSWDTFSYKRKVSEKIDKVNDFVKDFIILMNALHNGIIKDFDKIWDSVSKDNKENLLLKYEFNERDAKLYSNFSWDDKNLDTIREDLIKRSIIRYVADHYDTFISNLINM